MLDIVEERYIVVHGDSPIRPRIYSIGYAPSLLRPHMDDYYRSNAVMHLVFEGEGSYNGYPVAAGQGFLVRGGSFESHAASLLLPWSYLWFELAAEDAEALFAYCGADENGIFSFRNHDKTRELLAAFLMRERVAISTLAAQSFFSELLSAAFEREERASLGGAATHYRNICRYFFKNMARPLRMTEVAAEEHIDVQYMYNLFMRFAHISPKKYLTALRIDKACRLLRESPRSVSEIGGLCGYGDVLQFSKFFTSAMQMSPSEYRRRCIAMRPQLPENTVDIRNSLLPPEEL